MTARRATYALVAQQDSTFRYVLNDHLGSASGLLTEGGALVSTTVARYRPFGGTLTQPTNPALHIGYTGHDRTTADTSLNLITMNARYTMPGTGRFLSADTLIPDPGNSQAFNRYSYVLGNPIRLIDPSGRFSEEAIYSYILGTECGGSYHCADDMFYARSQNSAWWLMLLSAEAGDILYGMYANAPGWLKLTGNGASALSGLIADNGVGVKLSSLLKGKHTISNYGSNGQHLQGLQQATISVAWEAIWYRSTGYVRLLEEFVGMGQAVTTILGSQYIPPTVGSVLRSAARSAGHSMIGDVIGAACSYVGQMGCSYAYAGLIGAVTEATRGSKEQGGNLIRRTAHREFISMPNWDTASVTIDIQNPQKGEQLNVSYQPPIIRSR